MHQLDAKFCATLSEDSLSTKSLFAESEMNTGETRPNTLYNQALAECKGVKLVTPGGQGRLPGGDGLEPDHEERIGLG